MAAPKLVFQIKSLPQTGENIQFTVGGQAYTITVVNFTTVGVGEVSNVTTPSKTVSDVKQFQDNLKDAFNRLNIVDYLALSVGNDIVEYESSVDDVAHNFSAVTDSANIDLIQQIDSGVAVPAPGNTDGEIFNISIQHECKEYYPAEPRDFLYGNAGDVVTTTIDFSTNVALSYITFNYNLVENSVDPYPSSDDFVISDDFWLNSYTDTIQSFTGGVGVLSIGTPKQGVSGYAELFDLGGNNYRIVHEHILQPIVRLGDTTVNSVIIPDEFNGSNAVKYIFKIEGRNDLINPEPDVSTNNVNLSSYFKVGNTGFVDEFLNNGDANYRLFTDFSFNTGDGEIDKNQDSVTNIFFLKNTVGNWVNTADLIVYVQEIKDTFEQSLTLEQNLNIERLAFKADAVPVSGTNILNATATIDVDNTLLGITFEIAENTVEGDYIIWIAASNDNANVNHNNVFLQRGIAGLAADETTVQFGTYTNAPRADFNFNYHYNNDITNSFNQIKSFIEDRFVNRFRITSTPVNTLVKFTLGVKRTSNGEILESFDVFASSIDFATNRSFKLETTDVKNELEVTEVATDTWDFVYGSQIWKSWVDYTDVVFFAACTFIQDTASGETVEFTKEFWSPNFELSTYDTTQNTIAEPQALRSPNSIQFYDELTLTEVKGIIKNRDTRVTATFQDDNLNDLQLDEADMTGYISVNAIGDNQNTYEMFHATVSNGVLRPFEQITGEVSFLAKITKIDIKTAKIEAVILYDKLKSLFPNAELFDVTARLDKIQAALSCIAFMTNVNPGIDGNFTVSWGGVAASPEWRFEDGSKVLTQNIDTAGNGLDGTLQTVSFCAEDLSVLQDLQISDNKIVGHVDATKLTGIIDDILFNDNPELTSIQFANGIQSNLFYGQNCDLTGALDTSNVQTSTQFQVNNNPNLTGINLDNSATNINRFYVNDCNITGDLDLKNKTFNNLFFVNGNPNLTSISNINDNGGTGFTQFYFHSCNITGVLDLSNLQNATSGNPGFVGHSNPNLTGIIFSALDATQSPINFQLHNCDLTGTLDLSTRKFGFMNNFTLYNNVNLTSVILSPTLNIGNAPMNFYNCNLDTVVNLDKYLELTRRNNTSWRFEDNNMTSLQVDKILEDFDTVAEDLGYTNRSLTVHGTNAAPTNDITILNAILNAGTGYIVNDIITPTDGGGAGAQIQVDSVGGSGEILTASIINGGSGYTSVPTTFIGGTGSGVDLELFTYVLSIVNKGFTVTTS